MNASLLPRPLVADLPRVTLRLDGVVSAAVGLVLVVGTRPVDRFLGLGAPLALAAFGAICFPYAAMLLLAARRPAITRPMMLLPILLNTGLVVASAGLLLGGAPDLTRGGTWTNALFGDAAALLAAAQFVARRRLQ